MLGDVCVLSLRLKELSGWALLFWEGEKKNPKWLFPFFPGQTTACPDVLLLWELGLGCGWGCEHRSTSRRPLDNFQGYFHPLCWWRSLEMRATLRNGVGDALNYHKKKIKINFSSHQIGPSFQFFHKSPHAVYFAILHQLFPWGNHGWNQIWFNEANFISEFPQTVRKIFRENISCWWLP